MNCPHCKQSLTQVGKFWICAEHGQIKNVSKSPQDQDIKKLQKIFISYGRADALEFAKQLASDLKRLGAYDVFFDTESIEKGGLFEVVIEKGIRSSNVVIAVMTHHSLREESVCRDEVVFALNEGKKVLLLLKDPSPPLKPSLLLCRRNWIDFTNNYEEGLSALRSYLDGDESAAKKPRLQVVTGVKPLDFSLEIARYSQGFTGREWINKEINSWLTEREERAFVIVAEPGVGKSSVAAWLSLTRQDDVAGIHFCTQQNTRSLDPHEFVASLIGQLQARIPGLAEVIETASPDIRRPTASDAFRELIIETSYKISAQKQPMLIIVDSLDAAATREGETVLDVLVRQGPELPSWLRIITTTRPEPSILNSIKKLNVFELLTEGWDNKNDVRNYITYRINEPELTGILEINANAAAIRIEELAKGNFLYAKLVLDDLQKGLLKVEDLGGLTDSLMYFYHRIFSRRFPDINEYEESYAPMLRVLAAARGPLSFKLLQLTCNVEEETLNRNLMKIRPYLRLYGESESSGYMLFHKSMQEWLSDRGASGEYWLQVKAGHKRLAEVLLSRWQEDEYAVRHLPAHLIESHKWNELEDILTNLKFIETKCSAGMTYELVEDYLNALRIEKKLWSERKSVEEFRDFVLKESHVLREYPELTFQQAVNQPDSSVPHKKASALLEKGLLKRPWLKWLNKPQQANACVMTIPGHACELNYCDYSPNGKHIISASADNTLKIWNAETGNEMAEMKGHNSYVLSCDWSPDEKYIVSASADHTLRIWNSETGEEITKLQGHSARINSCSYSPDGSRIVSSSSDKTLKIWSSDKFEELGTLKGHSGWVNSCAWSPDGSRIVSSSSDKTLKIWSSDKFEELGTLKGHAGWVNSCAWSPDGSRIVSASSDRTVKVWDALNHIEIASLQGHTKWVNDCSYSPDGKHIISVSNDRTLRIWNIEMCEETGVLYGHSNRINSCRYSPDGKRIVSASNDRTLKIWNVEICEETGVLHEHSSRINSCRYSPDGMQIVSASHDNTLKVWDVKTGLEITSLIGHSDIVNSCVWAPDGSTIVSCSYDGTLKIWDAITGEEIMTLQGHSGWVNSCAWSPDGSRIVSASSDKTIKIWDARNGQELATCMAHDNWVNSCAWSPDGSRIVSASSDRTIKVWITDTMEELTTLRSHSGRVNSCVYSPDGSCIASASSDKTIRIWDAKTFSELATLKGHSDGVFSCAFSSDGKLVISASKDNTIRIWEWRTLLEKAKYYAPITSEVDIDKFSRVVAGDSSGTMYILQLINKCSKK